MERTKADQIGMLATVMNCIYVSDAFRTAGMETEVYTPFVCGAFTELFSKDKAVKALDEGRLYFLQVEQDILISQQIQQQHFVRSRLKQMRSY